MKSNLKFFKGSKILSVDKFLNNVLYDKKNGYYSSSLPFGIDGDFLTAPKFSRLFSEMIAVWIVSTWNFFGKPKNLNIVELGPGDGSMMKILLKTFKKFPEFDSSKKVHLYEKSKFLIRKQKIVLKEYKVKWISNFNNIKDGPVIFIGNEFFDAIPIKQFKRKDNYFLEKFYYLKKNYQILEKYKKASQQDVKLIKSFKCLKKLRFIELPKDGLLEITKIIKKISKLNGCLLMIDYGYNFPNNQNTLQSVMKHKKNNYLENLGKADITSHVNFTLLKEFLIQNNLKVKKILNQREFLKNVGIMERAEIIAKKMSFREKTNLFLRLKRLISPRLMGDLFKVILAYKHKNNNYLGF